MVQGPGQFFAAPADKGGRLLDGDPGRLRHQGAGLGGGQAFHRHPAGHDQGLSLGPAFGQAPSHQELVEPGLHLGIVLKVQGSRFAVGCVLRTISSVAAAGEDARPTQFFMIYGWAHGS